MMKYVLLVLAVSAGIQASPLVPANEPQPRFVDDLISAAVEEISSLIVEAGFDPFHLDSFQAGYGLPVPVLFNANVRVDNVELTGISDIVINKINFSLLSLRLTLDISLPKIVLSIGDSDLEIMFFGNKFDAQLAGSVTITEPRVAGVVSVRLGGSSGVSVNQLNLELSLGGLYSLLDVHVMGNNISPQVNTFISTTIPNTLNQYKDDINELLNTVLKDILDDML